MKNFSEQLFFRIHLAASVKIPTPPKSSRLLIRRRELESPDGDKNFRVLKNLSYITCYIHCLSYAVLKCYLVMLRIYPSFSNEQYLTVALR